VPLTEFYSKLKKFKLRKTAAYYLDRLINKSLAFQLFILLAPVLTATLVGGVLVLALGKPDLLQDLWWAFLRVLDTGSIAEDKDLKTGTLSLLLTIFGLLVWGTMISIIQQAFERQMIRIKSGKREVLETGHSLVMGWNSTIFNIIIELFQSDDNTPPKVVVLADKPREEMERQLNDSCLEIWKLMNLKTSSKLTFERFLQSNVICRSGNIDEQSCQKMVNLKDARAVIILQDDQLERNSRKDARSVKALFMALLEFDYEKRPVTPIVATPAITLSVSDQSIKESINSFDAADKVRVHASAVPELMSRIIAQTTLQPELRVVYNDLLDFSGNEFHLIGIGKGLTGLSYDDLAGCFKQALPVGYFTGKGRDGMPVGTLVLNPTGEKAQMPLCSDDRLIVLAENAEIVATFDRAGRIPVGDKSVKTSGHSKKILVVGKGDKSAQVVNYLTAYLHEESTIYYTGSRFDSPGVQLEHIPCGHSLDDQCCVVKDYLHKIAEIDTVVFVDDESNPEIHDSEMLIKIKTAKRFQNVEKRGRISIVAEFLDPRTKPLANLLDVHFAIVTTKFAGNYLVQCVRQPDLAQVFQELLGASGNEVCIRKREDYAIKNSTASFEEIMRAAREHGEIAIGYFMNSNNAAGMPELKLNPSDRAKPIEALQSIISIGNYTV